MDRNKLNNNIKSYKRMYKEAGVKKLFVNRIINHIDYKIFKMLVYSQKYRYYKDLFKQEKKIIHFLKYVYFGRKYYKYSGLTNCEIYCEFGENVKLFHGGIVINDRAVIGNNVKFHGNNCVGNNGQNNNAPYIGNNVDIGFGAIIIGDVKLADNIIVGANSIVTKSFNENGITIAGCPAKKISM